MRTTYCIFEDEKYINLLPLAYTRPVFDLRCGILTLKEKIIQRTANKNIVLHSRKYLEECIKERNPNSIVNKFNGDKTYFINGRIIADNFFIGNLKKLKPNQAFVNKDVIIAAFIEGEQIKKIVNGPDGLISFNNFKELEKIEIDIKIINYPWDLVNYNGEEIQADFELLVKNVTKSYRKYRGIEIENPSQVYIANDAEIDPFVFIDASDGPVYIGNKVKIMAHSYIQGPAFIGDNSLIKTHTSIFHNTSIGEVCKVGGEIDCSIIHSYSNKQHEGFLGHSYLGSWVNIGAGTNNSDLKNNYENISLYINGKQVNSGSQFVGLIMGDHSKTAINTMFNTGSVVGVSCNIFGSNFPARYIPSFCWGGSEFLRTYDIKKGLEVAKIVTKRRNIELSANETQLLNYIFTATAKEREKL